MERHTQSVYVVVRIDLPAEMEEFEANEVVSEMEYHFDYPAILDTEMSGVSMTSLGF